jgi:hypothetical protein
MKASPKRENHKNGKSKAAFNKVLVKSITPEELNLVKNTVKNLINDFGTAEKIIEKFGQDILPSIRSGKLDIKAIGGSIENFKKVLTVYGLDTHFPLEESVEKKYQPLVVEFSRQLIQEYDCKTSGEKALAEVIVSAYARILIYSRHLNGATAGHSFNKLHLGLYSVLSKELDRANRHFITALTMLKQLKSPSIGLNITAKTAFVSQNQQINTTDEDPKTPNHPSDEIIDQQ